jgi:apolipoprotein D and lipocalin family protein
MILAMLVMTTVFMTDRQADRVAVEVRTVDAVDLDRYVGDWFEIARYPNRFQRQCEGDVQASYARRADGRIDVVNRCRTAEGLTRRGGSPASSIPARPRS